MAKLRLTRHTAILLWVAGWFWLAAVILYPVSIGLTRFAGVALTGLLFLGTLALWWRRRWLRWSLLALGAIVAALLLLPGRNDYDRLALRQEVVRALLRYEGVRYVWGGENPLGIDCSGLVRRSAIEGTAWRGLRTANPLLLQTAVRLWWHDTSAKELAAGAGKAARKVTDTPSLEILADRNLHPGDFAITRDGVHALVYAGDHLWLEADPGEGRVIRLRNGRDRNQWLQMPVTIMRWRCLELPKR